MNSQIKNVMTNVAGIIGLIGVILGVVISGLAGSHLTIPVWLTVITSCCVGLPIAIIGWYSGKNPDGSVKTMVQVTNQLNPVLIDNAIAAYAKVNNMTGEQCSIKCEDNNYLHNVIQWYNAQQAPAAK